MPNHDIRWIQRFENYKKALARLTFAVDLSKERSLSDLEQQGLIQAFEFTFDLAWKTLQDLLRYKQRPNSNGGPIVILNQALEDSYITNEKGWRQLKGSREMTSHTYNEDTADDIADKIVTVFHGLFIQMETRLQVEKLNEEQQG